MGKTCRMSRITASAHNKALKLFLMSQKSQKRLEDLLVKNVQEGAPAQPLVHPESKRLRIRTIKSSLKDGHCTTKVFSGALGKLLEETSANAKLGNSNDAMNLYMGPLVAEEEQVMRQEIFFADTGVPTSESYVAAALLKDPDTYVALFFDGTPDPLAQGEILGQVIRFVAEKKDGPEIVQRISSIDFLNEYLDSNKLVGRLKDGLSGCRLKPKNVATTTPDGCPTNIAADRVFRSDQSAEWDPLVVLCFSLVAAKRNSAQALTEQK